MDFGPPNALQRNAPNCYEGRFLEGNAIGQRADLCGRHDAHVAIGARRYGGIGGAIALFQMGDAFAHGLDDAGRLHAEGVG